ncbi:HTH-type transcriptional regulator / antitoxin HigA [Porphyromonadaceae bacterium NLAE-zl-C104]|jgi:HTH-type transcriptional regulator/antitoxin HigA|uniref:HigA family addiction module antitoxin n=1 Tax=Proteiniphilum TaxID=294702 RepID=UPI000898C5F8|nr:MULTISPECIES: HigA family addiction module antitoxin [Proteiniphilum]MDY9917952.1 HigA family addiction module antitoxin [Proteiniphilum sp.]SDZ79102.1 HTH-type transcriptional regulator / antitoxin HigA [Porphyromonadaceae bacterium KH3R12]SFS84712.1 HTH-type transcriptional regulator / antitoxin HigA [Porphyromonadaceae bacterium NLAE-zl-C104]
MNTVLPKYPTHPGTLIKEELIEMGNTTQKELASSLGITPSYLSEVINGKRAINASLAIGLEEVFGISAEYWLRFQAQYDLDILRISRINKPITKKSDQLFYEKEFTV